MFTEQEILQALINPKSVPADRVALIREALTQSFKENYKEID